MLALFNPKNLTIEYEPRDTAQPFRIIDISSNVRHILFFCSTKSKAEDFIKNPRKYRDPIEAQLKEYSVSITK